MVYNKEEKKALIIFKMYIEGEISFESFWNQYYHSDSLMKYLCKFEQKNGDVCLNANYINERFNGVPDFFLKAGLQKSIIKYLKKKNIKFVDKTKESYLWNKWFTYIPDFVPLSEEVFCELEKMDNGSINTPEYYIEYYKQFYKCETYMPEWLQMSEWPFNDDGSPTKFLYQSGFPESDEIIEYWFEKKDGSRIKIEQFD